MLPSADSQRPAGVRQLLRGWSAAALLLALSALVLAPQPASAASGTLSVMRGKVATTWVGSDPAPVSTVRFTVPTRNATPVYLGLQLKSTDANSGYRAKISIAANGFVNGSFSRAKSGQETAIGSVKQLPITAQSGESIYMRAAITSSPTRLYLKVWKSGNEIPDLWQLAAEESNGTGGPNGSGVYAFTYLSTRAGAASTAVQYAGTSVSPLTSISTAKLAGTQWATANTIASNPPSVSDPTGTDVKAPTAPKAGFPTADNTGPTNTAKLKKHTGDIVVTKAGAVIENLDIYGVVTVKAANVTIRNSIVRGGAPKGYPLGLITNYGNKNLVIEDTLIHRSKAHVEFNGIKGNNFTARRVHIIGGVDNVQIHSGHNVTITDSLLEDTDYFSKDPGQSNGPTHNDSIQILSGENIVIRNNTIRGATNFAILSGAHNGPINTQIQNNYLDGGHCTVKLQTGRGYANKVTLTDNTFGPNQKERGCSLTAYPDVQLSAKGNVLTTGEPVRPIITVS